MKIAQLMMKILSIGGMAAVSGCAPLPSPPSVPPMPPAWSLTSNGCKVWNSTPASENSVSWDGACVDGYAQGPGRLTWFRNGAYSQNFVGVMLAGKRSGTGDYYWANGDHYSGPFINDDRTGKGSYVWGNGDRYSGDFLAGKRTGYGSYVFANGDRFDGEQRDSSFINGMLVDPAGGPIAKFVNGQRIALRSDAAKTPEAPSSDSPSMFGSMLGAVAQGMASAGGKNASQYQAIANAMNNGSGAAGAAGTGLNSAPAVTAGSAGNNAAGASNAANVSTQPMVNNCLSLTRKSKYTMRINNSCGFEVSMIYCYTSIANPAPVGYDVNANVCSGYRWYGSANMIVGAASFIDVNAPNNSSPVKFIACKSANNGYPDKLYYDGASLTGQCHFSAAASNTGGSRSSGGVR